MRSGVRPGRQTEREERDSGVATVGVGSVAHWAGTGTLAHTSTSVTPISWTQQTCIHPVF